MKILLFKTNNLSVVLLYLTPAFLIFSLFFYVQLVNNHITKLTILFSVFISSTCFGQTSQFADSIRIAYDIPELNYAVVSSSNIIEIQALGFKQYNSTYQAALTDKFRIGSNTKTVTSYMAFLLVKKGVLKWETKFFDLYPELKTQSNSAYYNLTLQDLLTFRAHLMNWTYTYEEPAQTIIKGNEKQQRYEFVAWILQQKPRGRQRNYYFSNPSYVAVGLMLEKATGKDYKTLVYELGDSLDIDFGFGQPNFYDTNQTWGHSEDLEPEGPAENYKLNWLSSAGNLNVTLPDYAKFIQLQLQGLSGKSNLLTADEFYTMHFGLQDFAFGWNWYVDEQSQVKYSWHTGNPGTFFTKVFICKETDRAYIFFANVGSEKVENGITILFEELKRKYDH